MQPTSYNLALGVVKMRNNIKKKSLCFSPYFLQVNEAICGNEALNGHIESQDTEVLSKFFLLKFVFIHRKAIDSNVKLSLSSSYILCRIEFPWSTSLNTLLTSWFKTPPPFPALNAEIIFLERYGYSINYSFRSLGNWISYLRWEIPTWLVKWHEGRLTFWLVVFCQG